MGIDNTDDTSKCVVINCRYQYQIHNHGSLQVSQQILRIPILSCWNKFFQGPEPISLGAPLVSNEIVIFSPVSFWQCRQQIFRTFSVKHSEAIPDGNSGYCLRNHHADLVNSQKPRAWGLDCKQKPQKMAKGQVIVSILMQFIVQLCIFVAQSWRYFCC